MAPRWPLFQAKHNLPGKCPPPLVPLWPHVGFLAPFLIFLVPFLALLAPSWPHFGWILECQAFIWKGFRVSFCIQFLIYCDFCNTATQSKQQPRQRCNTESRQRHTLTKLGPNERRKSIFEEDHMCLKAGGTQELPQTAQKLARGPPYHDLPPQSHTEGADGGGNAAWPR